MLVVRMSSVPGSQCVPRLSGSHMSISQAAVGVMSVEPLPEQEEVVQAAVGVMSVEPLPEQEEVVQAAVGVMSVEPLPEQEEVVQAAVGVMSVEPLPEQEEVVVGVVNNNLPWQHWLHDLIPWLPTVNTMYIVPNEQQHKQSLNGSKKLIYNIEVSFNCEWIQCKWYSVQL